MVRFSFFGSGGQPAGGDPVNAEVTATIQAFEACGYTTPDDITTPSLISGIGKAFTPEELASAEFLTDVSPQTRQYFGREVQPNLVRGARQSEENTLQLAHQIGRLTGAVEGTLFTPRTPLEINNRGIHVDGQRLPFNVETGKVIEYGMGVNGLFTHVENVKKGRYSVLGIHRSIGEVAVLRGILDYRGIPEEQMRIVDRGIAYSVDKLLSGDGRESADLIIASRVHTAGTELRHGIQKSAALLRPDGQLIARGPQRYSGGMNYNDVLRLLNKSRGLSVIINHEFNEMTRQGVPEPNRLIVAQKS